MSSSTAPFAPVTPTRRTSFAAVDKAPLVAPSNPRKRRLPPSPVKPAFSLSPPPPRTRPFLASHTLSLTTSAPCSFARSGTPPLPPAPLLPPAPIFDVLPLPPVTPTSSTSTSTASLRSSPMRRSPAMKDLAAFTRNAYAGENSAVDEGFERKSASRLELGGAAYRRGMVDAWSMNEDSVDVSSAATTYSPATSTSSSMALGLGLGLGFSSRFGEDDLPLRPTSRSPSFPSLALSFGAALEPSSHPSTPSTPGLSPSSTASHLSPSSSTSYSTSSASTSSWLATSPVPLPFAHLSLSSSPLDLGTHHLGDGCSGAPSPSSLALRRMDSLERRRRGKGPAALALHEREVDEERGEPFVGLGLEL
ncbi:hypothetical protein JCM8208_006127 [Rhodotorula glutinis]